MCPGPPSTSSTPPRKSTCSPRTPTSPPPPRLDAPPPGPGEEPGAEGRFTAGRAGRAQVRVPSGGPDLPRGVVGSSERERILDATAEIVAEKGLAALTIPEIASRANVSHE